MSDITTDPKFVPAAASLSVVGIKVSEIRTDEALKDFVQGLSKSRVLTDAQEAVAIYVARKRGHDFEWILTELGIDERTAKRREVEGMAIIRLQEITRCVSAIRTGGLGIKVVDEITAKPVTLVGEHNTDARIIELETIAAAKDIQRTFQTSDGKPLSDEAVAQIVRQASDTVVNKVEPMTARNIVRAVPSISEQHGIVVKPASKRTPQTNQSGPFGLEHHFKAALADVKALVDAADGEEYVITPNDARALLSLLTFLGLDADTLAAVDALVAF